MKFYLKIKNKDSKYYDFAVQEEVYVYVKQLEHYIKYPKQSKLKEVYKERFV